MRSGDKSIIYQYCHGCNNFICVYFDQNTNLITEIGFIDQT
jgi:Pyruvate/2-oxoacid:ferredoxin oxidoreductase delta subunit